MSDETSKVIFIDWGVYLHKSIFVWAKNRSIPATWNAFNMIIGDLKKVGCSPDDLIIVATDSPSGSWRRAIDPNYKANRRENREKHVDIDWKYWFGKFDELLTRIEAGTPFHILQIEKFEADDIIAEGVRHYKDKICIIISIDKDYEQLVLYPNVRLFSPISKKYKLITTNPYKILESKIKKEAADNLVTPILSKQDYEKRKLIVNLLSLPVEITKPVNDVLDKINSDKDYDLDQIPFNSLRGKFMDIYNSDKIVSYDKCMNPKEKKGGKNGTKSKDETQPEDRAGSKVRRRRPSGSDTCSGGTLRL